MPVLAGTYVGQAPEGASSSDLIRSYQLGQQQRTLDESNLSNAISSQWTGFEDNLAAMFKSGQVGEDAATARYYAGLQALNSATGNRMTPEAMTELTRQWKIKTMSQLAAADAMTGQTPAQASAAGGGAVAEAGGRVQTSLPSAPAEQAPVTPVAPIVPADARLGAGNYGVERPKNSVWGAVQGTTLLRFKSQAQAENYKRTHPESQVLDISQGMPANILKVTDMADNPPLAVPNVLKGKSAIVQDGGGITIPGQGGAPQMIQSGIPEAHLPLADALADPQAAMQRALQQPVNQSTYPATPESSAAPGAGQILLDDATKAKLTTIPDAPAPVDPPEPVRRKGLTQAEQKSVTGKTKVTSALAQLGAIQEQTTEQLRNSSAQAARRLHENSLKQGLNDIAQSTARVASMPSYKGFLAQTDKNFNAWFKNASPDALVAAGMKDVGAMRLSMQQLAEQKDQFKQELAYKNRVLAIQTAAMEGSSQAQTVQTNLDMALSVLKLYDDQIKAATKAGKSEADIAAAYPAVGNAWNILKVATGAPAQAVKKQGWWIFAKNVLEDSALAQAMTPQPQGTFAVTRGSASQKSSTTTTIPGTTGTPAGTGQSTQAQSVQSWLGK